MKSHSRQRRVPAGFRTVLVAILSAGVACVVGPVGSADAAFIHSFDSYLGGGSLAGPQALAVDQTTGDLYIIEHGNGCVSRYYGERGGPEALEPHDFPATGTNQVCGIEFREPPYFFGEGTANSNV